MSIQRRFFFSVAANLVRALASLAVGLLVARGLGPNDYGNLAYLFGSFWAIRALLDMGSSSAFYTFIAERHRGRNYYLVYFAWLGFQFFFSAILVAVLLPDALVERFWVGQERNLIFLALLANFLQNQVWQTVVQLYEAGRQTVRIQFAGVLIISSHFVLMLAALLEGWMGIHTVLWAIVAEYSFATIWLTATLHSSVVRQDTPDQKIVHSDVKAALSDYISYCKPMFIIAVASFLHEIADRWLLQRFGGSSQQGFYQVASQLSTISLLATSSILNIFWKEIAEACNRGDRIRVITLHQKTTRLLVFVASVVSCFLAPWAELLVDVLLGPQYHSAWPVLVLMLFYPIHQAMGQINGTLFMATRKNSLYMKISVTGLLLGIPVSYAMIAPSGTQWIPGLELGAMGLAIKIVGLNLLFVNIQAWVIARDYDTKYRWVDQFVIIFTLLSLGYLARYTTEWGIPILTEAEGSRQRIILIAGMGLSGVIYLSMVLALVMRAPSVIGLNPAEVQTLRDRIRTLWQKRTG